MAPHIDGTSFGSIVVDGKKFDHDILIRMSGKIKKRKKKLSKKIYGSSHTISQEEAEYVFEQGCHKLIIGCGQQNCARLSEEAQQFFERLGVICIQQPTPQAIETYNQIDDEKIGLFHITC